MIKTQKQQSKRGPLTARFARCFSYALGMIIFFVSGCSKEIEPDSARINERVFGSDSHSRNEIVLQNMQALQLGAEHYAADNKSETYPLTLDEKFKTYLPGGKEGEYPAAIGMLNPFNAENEFPLVINKKANLNKNEFDLPLLDSSNELEKLRRSKRFKVKRGAIVYFSLDKGKAYAIIGGDHEGLALTDALNENQILVLSNIDQNQD